MTLDGALLGGIITGLAGIITAAIALAGKRDEVASSSTKNLLEGQTSRIDRLEARLDRVENALREERHHSWRLHRALSRAVEYITQVTVWLAGDRQGAPPSPPDVVQLRELLDAPRARNPPDDRDAT